LRKQLTTIAGEQSLGLEMLETLYSYYLLRAVSSEIESRDALTNMSRMKFVQLLTNDIILRLCKFRDDNSMSLSFDQVNKALRKRAAKKERLDGIETRSKNISVSRTIWKIIVMPILLIFQRGIGTT
jgi:hypothetical protein